MMKFILFLVIFLYNYYYILAQTSSEQASNVYFISTPFNQYINPNYHQILSDRCKNILSAFHTNFVNDFDRVYKNDKCENLIFKVDPIDVNILNNIIKLDDGVYFEYNKNNNERGKIFNINYLIRGETEKVDMYSFKIIYNIYKTYPHNNNDTIIKTKLIVRQEIPKISYQDMERMTPYYEEQVNDLYKLIWHSFKDKICNTNTNTCIEEEYLKSTKDSLKVLLNLFYNKEKKIFERRNLENNNDPENLDKYLRDTSKKIHLNMRNKFPIMTTILEAFLVQPTLGIEGVKQIDKIDIQKKFIDIYTKIEKGLSSGDCSLISEYLQINIDKTHISEIKIKLFNIENYLIK